MNRYFPILSVFALAIVLGCEPDTSSSPEPEDIFVKFYGSDAAEVAEDLIVNDLTGDGPTEDDGYVIYGTSNSSLIKTFVEDPNFVDEGINQNVYYLIFTDNQGNEVDVKAYNIFSNRGTEGNVQDQVATDIIQTRDGGFLLAGYTTVKVAVPTQSGNEDRDVKRGVLIKLDENGDDEWGPVFTTSDDDTTAFITRILDTETEENFNVPIDETIESVIETLDGNLLLIGTTNNVIPKPGFNRINDATDIWLVKFGPDGIDNEIFSKIDGFPSNDVGKAIFERPDGSLALIASGPGNEDENGSVDILFANSDSELFTNNFREFSDLTGADIVINDAEIIPSIIPNGGSVLVTGSSGGETFVMSINSGGSEDFFKIIEFDALENQNGVTLGSNSYTGHLGLGITPMNNGSIAVIGTLQGFKPGSETVRGDRKDAQKQDDILFFTINAFGEFEDNNFVRTFGGNDEDIGKELRQLTDGRFVLLGTVGFEGGPKMISLMKTSSRGTLIK